MIFSSFLNRVSEYLMGDLDTNISLSSSVSSKTKVCHFLLCSSYCVFLNTPQAGSNMKEFMLWCSGLWLHVIWYAGCNLTEIEDWGNMFLWIILTPQATCCHNPEGHNMKLHHCWKLSSLIIIQEYRYR